VQVLEAGTLSAYKFRGWFNVWNGLDAITYALQISIAVLHLSRHVDSGYLSIVCALQCIMLLFRWGAGRSAQLRVGAGGLNRGWAGAVCPKLASDREHTTLTFPQVVAPKLCTVSDNM
jgi:hypothetical protein